MTWFPSVFNWLIDKALQMMSKKAFPYQPKEWKLSPTPSVATTSPLVADAIYPFLKSGFAEPVSPVQQITGPKSMQLTDGRVLEDIDTIIYCTGYEFSTPFVPPEYNPYPVLGEPPVLYRNIFSLHPDPAVRNSLAFAGQCGIPFPGFVQFELTGMAISQVWRGKSQLPPLSEMEQWHRNRLAWRQNTIRKSKVDSNFYAVFVPFPDHLAWLDETAGTGLFKHFGLFSWTAWRFWWSDPEFYTLCKTGLLSPALWRLFDMGRRKPWAGAKAQIKADHEFAGQRSKERAQQMKKAQEDKAKKGK